MNGSDTDLQQKAAFALTGVLYVRRVLGHLLAKGELREPLWIDQDETLVDRLDLVATELRRGDAPTGWLVDQGVATLRTAARILRAADRVGMLRDRQCASPFESLLSHLDVALEELAHEEGVAA